MAIASFDRRALVACWAGLAFVAGVVPAWGARCRLPGDGVVTQRGPVRIAGQVFTVAAVSVADLNDERSRLSVLDRRCRAVWSETVDGTESRFDVRRLGGTILLQFVTLQVFGDGTGFVHRLLVWRGGRLAPALPPIAHRGTDGFHLGRLAGGGAGIVTWVADPAGESEAAAHPYVVTTWPWLRGRFGMPVHYESAAKYLAPANAAARAMRLPYRDETGVDRFMDLARLRQSMAPLSTR